MRKKLLNGISNFFYGAMLSAVTLSTSARAEPVITSLSRGEAPANNRATPTLTIISAKTMSVGGSLIATAKTSATKGRGGIITFTVTASGSGSATVDPHTGVIKAISTGTITLIATSAGDGHYHPVSTQQAITIKQGIPKLVFTSPHTVHVGGVLTVMVKTTPDHHIGSITYHIMNGSGAALLDQNTGLLTALSAGTVTLIATSSGNADYTSATTKQMITIKKGVLTLGIASTHVLSVDDNLTPVVTRSDTYNRGGSIRFSVIKGSGSATVDPNTGMVKAVSSGKVILTATSSGDDDYESAVTSQEITINPGMPVLTITSNKEINVDRILTAAVKTTATGGRGGAITFAIVTEDGYAEVDSLTGFFKAITVGAVTLTATSAGDSDYYPATVSQQIMINQTSPTLTITSANTLNVDELLRVKMSSSATDGLGGAIHYVITNGTGSALISSKGLIKAVSAGTVTLTVTSAGDSDYYPATVSQQITINRATPVLIITSGNTVPVDGSLTATVRTTAIGGRGGAVTFAIVTEDGYAEVDSHTGLIKGITAGTVTLTVTSAGDSDYNSVTASQKIIVTRTTPTLKITSNNVVEVERTLRARVTSSATDGLGGAFRYAISGGSGSATVDPSTGLITGIHTGTVTLTVTSAGDSDYYPASAIQKLKINPRTPVLTITSANTVNVYGSLTVTATTNAREGQGGEIIFMVSNGSGYAILDPYTKMLVGVKPGTVMLMAVSKGDTDYNMAAASQLVTINDVMPAKIESTLSLSEPVSTADRKVIVADALSPNNDGFNDTFIIQNIENYPDNKVLIFNTSDVRVFETNSYDNNTVVFAGKSNISGTDLPAGIYYYTIELHDQGKSDRYVGYFKLKR